VPSRSLSRRRLHFHRRRLGRTVVHQHVAGGAVRKQPLPDDAVGHGTIPAAHSPGTSNPRSRPSARRRVSSSSGVPSSVKGALRFEQRFSSTAGHGHSVASPRPSGRRFGGRQRTGEERGSGERKDCHVGIGNTAKCVPSTRPFDDGFLKRVRG
jgi:hypothetical protein